MGLQFVYSFVVIAVLSSTPGTGLAATDSMPSQIRFGSVAMDTPAVMHQRLLPLTQYLSDILGKPVTLKSSPSMSAAINDLSSGTVELAYLTPVAYIRSHEAAKAQLVVKTVTRNQGFFKLMIVVRKDSPIKSIDDLAGKSFAFGDRAALLQRAVVVGAGMPLDQLGEYKFLGHYDNIVRVYCLTIMMRAF